MDTVSDWEAQFATAPTESVQSQPNPNPKLHWCGSGPPQPVPLELLP